MMLYNVIGNNSVFAPSSIPKHYLFPITYNIIKCFNFVPFLTKLGKKHLKNNVITYFYRM